MKDSHYRETRRLKLSSSLFYRLPFHREFIKNSQFANLSQIETFKLAINSFLPFNGCKRPITIVTYSFDVYS